MRWAIYPFFLLSFFAGCTGPEPPEMLDSQNRVVDVVNTTDAPLHFYARNAERRSAGRERFGENDLAPHQYLTINFDDESGACLFDLHAAFQDGSEKKAERFDTCHEVSWVIQQAVRDEE